MYEVFANPVEQAAAIMRKHLKDDIKVNGSTHLGLQTAKVTDDSLTFSFPDWVIKSKEDICGLFGDREGFKYFGDAIKIIWKEHGAWKETH